MISIAQNNQKSTGNFVIDENGNIAELYIGFDKNDSRKYYTSKELFYATSDFKSNSHA